MTDFVTNAALRSIIQQLLAMPDNSVRPSHQNAPIKKGEEYATVLVTGEVAEGTDEIFWSDVPVVDPLMMPPAPVLLATENLSGVRLATAQIQYYNGDAFGQLRRLSQRLQSAVGTQLLADAGFAFSRVRGVQDITGLLPDEAWQTRALLQLDFYVEVNDAVETPLIVTVPFTLYSDDGQTRTSEVSE
jgi:hypothetical protein